MLNIKLYSSAQAVTVGRNYAAVTGNKINFQLSFERLNFEWSIQNSPSNS